MPRRCRSPSPRLARALEALRQRYQRGYLDSDPVRYVHRFEDPDDREVVAFFAASLAFGRVASIFASIENLLERLGPRPARTLERLDSGEGRKRARGFRHRWIGEETLLQAWLAIGRFRREHGNLERAFLAGDPGEADVGPAIESWSAAATAEAPVVSRSLRFLFPSPRGGSACKRMNLFLRWMVRPADGMDLGQWRSPDPSRLVIPLDTHVVFMGRALGLTHRRTPGWRMAAEITEALRHVDPDDPVKFDWALSRPGILGECLERRDAGRCTPCVLRPHCQPRRAASPGSLERRRAGSDDPQGNRRDRVGPAP